MDRSKILEEIRLKSLTVNRYVKENKSPIMTSPAAAASGAASGGGGSGPNYDTDVQKFLTASKISDTTIAESLDTFVKAMKGASLWDSTLAFYPLVTDAADESDAAFEQFKWNLKDTTKFKLAPFDNKFVSVTCTSRGLSDFGTPQGLLTTALRSENDVPLKNEGGSGNKSMLAGGYYLTTTGDTQYDVFGSSVLSKYQNTIVVEEAASMSLYWDNTGAALTIAAGRGADDLGTFITQADEVYVDEEEGFWQAKVDTLSTATDVVQSFNITRNAVPDTEPVITVGNNGGVLTAPNIISAYFLMNGKMSDAQLIKVRNLVNQLQTDLGRATH